MDARLQHRVQRYGWDRAASYYEESWRRQLEPAQSLLMQMAALRPGERVLDLACGTGLVTFRAAEAVTPTGTVLGTDISEAMVEQCRLAAQARGVSHATFERMAAEQILYPDRSFDAVLCALGMMYVVDFAGAVREAFRVTKAGGRTVSAVWGRRDRCAWAPIFEVVERRVQSDVCPMFFQLGTGDTQKALFNAAGYANTRDERIDVTLEYDSGEAACVAAFAGGPVAMAYARFDDATRESAHAEYLEAIAAFRRGNGYALPGEYVVTIGTRPAL
jgi:ubiquinone/menaquinone biosynthesis C-methylase UbiE